MASQPVAHNPDILKKKADEDLSPVYLFRVFWDDEIMEVIRSNTNMYH